MKFKISMMAVLVLSILFSTVAFASRDGECTLVNKTGEDIKAIYVSPITRNDWERCQFSYGRVLYNGDSTEISFELRRDVNFWDIRCTYTDGSEEKWYGVDLRNANKVILRSDGDFDISESRHRRYRDDDDDDDDDYGRHRRYRNHDHDDDHDDDYYVRRY